MYEELKIQHLHGPMDLTFGDQEAVVLCLVRNGEVFVDDFVEHYRSLGFSHIGFLDNDSTDNTVDRIRKHDHVTILRSGAPFKSQKLRLRHALMRIFGVGAWSVMADIDEFFYYPYAGYVSLKQFLAYLNRNKYTSVVTQMLDMVPDRSIESLLGNPINGVSEATWYFDTSRIEKKPYNIRTNVAANPEICLWYGGIRSVLFGMSEIFLTKHSMNYGDGRLIIFSDHTIGNRTVADVSGITLHYKFVGNVYEKTKNAVEEKTYYKDSIEYRAYLDTFNRSPDRRLMLSSSEPFQDARTLIEMGLYVVSEEYLRFVDDGRSGSAWKTLPNE